jgi:hypothetical protein
MPSLPRRLKIQKQEAEMRKAMQLSGKQRESSEKCNGIIEVISI